MEPKTLASRGLSDGEKPKLSNRDFEQIQIGEKAEFTKQLSQGEVETFARLTGDFNSIHLDEEFARRTFFRGRVVHGLLSGSLISRIIGMSLPGHGGVYLSQTFQFLKPVRTNDPLKVVAEVIEKNRDQRTLLLRTEIFNSQDELVVSGQAEVLVLKIRKSIEGDKPQR